MSRLTEWQNGELLVKEEERLLNANGIITKDEMYKIMRHLAEKLADYEDKQEQGLLIIAPCKSGDTIYLPWRYNGQIGIANLKVTKIVIVTGVIRVFTDFATDDEGFFEKFNGGMFGFSDFGEIVFRSEAEAEEALARMKGE